MMPFLKQFSDRFLMRFIIKGLFCAAILCICTGGLRAETLCLEETCRRISGKLASVSYKDCSEGELILSGAYSNKGVPILVKEYPPLPDRRKPQARVLVVGGTHGDEYSSISIVFRWMQILDVHHSGLFHWIFIPLLNPDGLFLERSTRTNAMGVDINRNFPAPLWREIGFKRWLEIAKMDPRYYPGTHPSSEPETKFLVDIIEAFQPDAIISIHAPLNLVDYDGPGTPPSQIGGLRLLRLGNFPGTLGNYAGIVKRIPVVTLELASSGRMPSAGDISAIWRDLVRWLINNIPAEEKPEQLRVKKEGLELEREFFAK